MLQRLGVIGNCTLVPPRDDDFKRFSQPLGEDSCLKRSAARA